MMGDTFPIAQEQYPVVFNQRDPGDEDDEDPDADDDLDFEDDNPGDDSEDK